MKWKKTIWIQLEYWSITWRNKKLFMKRDKKLYKVLSWLIFGVILLFVLIPIAINFLFERQAPVDILVAKWGAADALSYTAGALAFLGTMFLGWISWSQNNQLQRIETNSFIAQNSCMVLLKSFSFKGLNQKVVNSDTEHIEPIVIEKGLEDFNYGSFSLTMVFKRLDSYAAFVRVESLTMFVGEQAISAFVFAKAYDECYSRIAMSEETEAFELTVLLKPDTKRKVINALQQNCEIIIEIMVELVTANYVWTKIKCRGSFLKDNSSEKLQNNFSLNDQSPMCFWFGNGIIDSKTVKFRNELESKV